MTDYTSETARHRVDWTSSVQLRNNTRPGFFRLSPEQREAGHRREVQESARRRNEHRVNGLVLPKGVSLEDW